MTCTFWAKFPLDFNTTTNEIYVFKMGTTLDNELTTNVGDRA